MSQIYTQATTAASGIIVYDNYIMLLYIYVFLKILIAITSCIIPSGGRTVD